MTYIVDWVESKKDDWKVCTLREITEGSLTIDDVSINKVDKKGIAFPNFDQIMPGAQVHGNLWRSPAGRYTLFAPDPKPAATAARPATGGGNRGVAAAQERKAQGIEKAQDRKETGIMVASAMRDSTIIATALMNSQSQGEPWSFENFTDMLERVKKWYLAKWSETEKSLDIPF